MNTMIKASITAMFLASMAGCEVEKTQEGDMPSVSVDGGQMPEYEVQKTQEGEMPDVDIEGGQMPEYNVKTPDVDVEMEPKVVEVPTVDVEMPEDDENRTAGRDE